MDRDGLKRTLRELKRAECFIRFGNREAPRGAQLVWNRFFTASEKEKRDVKYPLCDLLLKERQEMDEIIADYFLEVIIRTYRENGQSGSYLDPELLDRLGLPADSGTEEVKKRFRLLAKQHHPDCGGDSARFIELMEVYRALTGNREL